MHDAALVCTALSGFCFCVAAAMRWQIIRWKAAQNSLHVQMAVWFGMLLLSVAIVMSFMGSEREPSRLSYALIYTWIAVASVFTFARLAVISRPGVLVFPMGLFALLLAAVVTVMPESPQNINSEQAWITPIHLILMGLHGACMLSALSAAVYYLVVMRRMKQASDDILSLPKLPALERMHRWSYRASMAFLIGGVITGGIAMKLVGDFIFFRPAPVLAIIVLVVGFIFFGLESSGKISRRALMWSSIMLGILDVLAVISVVLDGRHA